ncbi:MAG: hypothetical protein AAF902_23365 [Chloroflexota bacterium]
MTWNIRDSREAEYSEFVVNELIPRITRLGLGDLEFWYTRYGEADQIQASGVARTMDQMQNILGSEEWGSLQDMLSGYVNNYQQKLINSKSGFQI